MKPLADVLLDLKHIQYINISYISLKGLTEKDWIDFTYNIPNLRELNISNTQLSKAHYYLIFKYIPTLPLFTRLIMNNVGDISQRESYYIGQGLAKTQSLRDIQMQSICYYFLYIIDVGFDRVMFPVFTDQITLHQNITNFDFSNNPIEDQAILFLSRALNHWGNVQSIDLESIILLCLFSFFRYFNSRKIISFINRYNFYM